MAMPSDARYRELLRMSGEQRRPLAGLPPPQRQRLIADMTPQQRETVLALENPQMVVTSELRQAKLLRVIYGERQLEEVMADFWFNHFNVFMGKGADRYLLAGYERDVIRPHALGKFEDLLLAVAQSPAMLFYLDNWMSVGPNTNFAKSGHHGLNENYARELMELHTLGVDGGYTQHDVTEVAKVFTGWTLNRPRKAGEFEFDERKHEPGPKNVLGHEIQNQGQDEGRQVLHLLAQHPSTARFISTKLAQRFVADDPPPALVDKLAKKFESSGGDIREVLRTLFHSPEFWAPQTYRAKVKTPLEFIASAVRDTGANVQNAMPLVQILNQMGMPLYGSQPPTGYAMKAEAWVNSAALLSRMNFAINLTGGRVPGLIVDLETLLTQSSQPGMNSGPEAIQAQMESALLAADVSKQTHETIQKQLQDPQITRRAWNDPKQLPEMGVIAGLILGSPEFQRR
jgi:uncharacterized protein (DUF1800 family)